mmetsp:Transcript_54408/g.151569  ORF Transcript_54408/g.151569 Transcript_54408/m.151569 type:complete len:273 (+) Transcript_54408:56-874(+)
MGSFISCASADGKAVLYVIPFSHYCDLARWALTLAGVPFEERPYLPGVHMLFSPISKIRKRSGHPISGSSARLDSLPMLVSSDGNVVGDDSWQCLERLGQVPPRLKELLETVIGPCTRTIVYSYLLTSIGEDAFLTLMQAGGTPWWQRALMRLAGFRNIVRGKMVDTMVKNPDHVNDCRDKLRAAVVELETMLNTEVFHIDGKPTASAIAVASLLAPACFPPEYCQAFYGKWPLPFEDLPAPLREEVTQWRNTQAGKWVLEFYAKHGLPPKR